MIRRGAVLVLAALGAATAACARPRSGASTDGSTSVAAPTPDTAFGRVAEVGSDPMTWMSLQPAGGGTSLRLSGAGATALRTVSGTQVWVKGVRESNGFRVDVFEVRIVNDQPVDDGIVVVTPAAVAIRMRSGTQRDVPNAPPALREMPGARIWVSRPVPGVAPSYGVITRP